MFIIDPLWWSSPMEIRYAPSILLIILIALVCFSAVIHTLTYIGYDPRQVSQTLWYGLQFGSALVLIPAVILLYFKARASDFASAPSSKRNVVGVFFIVFTLYALFNFFFTSIVLNQDASPEVVNGQFALVRHGAVLKILTKQQFTTHQIYEARMNSGHWLALYTFAIVALWWKTSLQSDRSVSND